MSEPIVIPPAMGTVEPTAASDAPEPVPTTEAVQATATTQPAEPVAEAAPAEPAPLVGIAAAVDGPVWARPATSVVSADSADPPDPMEPPVQLREPIVELEHVGRTYHLGHVDVPALIDATLTVRRGEFVAIVGPSGSGKSTLMNIIGCLDRATSGLYRLAGTPISTLSDDELARVRSRTIGFVFQSYNLLPRTSALENVATPLMYQGVGRRERHERAAATLVRLGLGDRLNHVPTELSGGQQQRVAIARALVTDPALILADEPTGNLDSHSGAEVMNILHELHASGRTIVLITHDAKVASAAPRHALIADGLLTLPDEAVAA